MPLLENPLYLLNSHLGHFPANVVAFSQEQCESFRKDKCNMETMYQDCWNDNMVADIVGAPNMT